MREDTTVMDLAAKLRSQESKLLSRVALDIERPTRSRREVNLSRISRTTAENDTIIVPGKVLGGGELTHKVTISALQFSASALEKIRKSGSHIVPLHEMTKESIAGKRVRIIG